MIKDIVVHLTGSEEDEVRLAYAETLSERFEAHLTGLYVHMLPEVIGADPAGVIGMGEWFEQSDVQAQETFTRLKARFERLSMPHEVRQFDVFSGTAGQALTDEARTADLFIATRPYGDPGDAVHMEVSVLFGSGRACLFVPPKGVVPRGFGTVVVAWNGSREAARAVAEAMPLLKQASQVIVVVVREGDAAEFGGDIARHLSRHGIAAVIGTVDVGMDGPGAALLGEVRRVGANLLVMGGYGHSRFREWVLGGATRHVLSHADIPVLMAR
ncbi:MAG TPA: universal stress protein [Devosia sp.]|nr:universal stress protein [Devosia sp.]